MPPVQHPEGPLVEPHLYLLYSITIPCICQNYQKRIFHNLQCSYGSKCSLECWCRCSSLFGCGSTRGGKGDSTPHTYRSVCVWVIQVPATGHGRTKEDLLLHVKEHFMGKITVSHLEMNLGSPGVWKEVTARLSLLIPEQAASALSGSRWERQNHGCHTSPTEQNLHFNQTLKSFVAWWVWGMLI